MYEDVIGKRVLWEDLKRKYPYKYVGMKNVERSEYGGIISGVVLFVDDEEDDYKYVKYLGTDIVYIATLVHLDGIGECYLVEE